MPAVVHLLMEISDLDTVTGPDITRQQRYGCKATVWSVPTKAGTSIMFSLTVKKHDRRYCVDGEDFERRLLNVKQLMRRSNKNKNSNTTILAIVNIPNQL